MNKTAVTVLQELMVQQHDVPSYECVAQTGPHHQAVFKYKCSALGVTDYGVARCKKEAKQQAAWRVLAALAEAGHPVPPPYRTAPAPPAPADHPEPSDAPQLPSSSGEGGEAGAAGAAARDTRSCVMLLKELCEEYKLGAAEFELVSDTGPAHQRQFTVAARVGRHERAARGSTKKAARQLAAERLYRYLRVHLARATEDFVENCDPEGSARRMEQGTALDSPQKRRASAEASEPAEQSKRACRAQPEGDEEALSRALDKVMSRYVEAREGQPWRPALGLRVADYHLALGAAADEEQRAAALAALRAGGAAEQRLAAAAAALGLRAEPAALGGPAVVELTPAAPALAFAGRDARAAAAAAAINYIERALAFHI